jgi:hypothetical protein
VAPLAIFGTPIFVAKVEILYFYSSSVEHVLI